MPPAIQRGERGLLGPYIVTFAIPADQPTTVGVALCYHMDMSQPVKLSDTLVLDARLAGKALARSLAGQVEYWARIGRAVEALLPGAQALALCHSAAAHPLSALLESVDSPAGRKRVADFLQGSPFPHYQPYRSRPGLLVRIDQDGKRTVGRFVNREFRRVRIKRETHPS
jgi:hypothetical protein